MGLREARAKARARQHDNGGATKGAFAALRERKKKSPLALLREKHELEARQTAKQRADAAEAMYEEAAKIERELFEELDALEMAGKGKHIRTIKKRKEWKTAMRKVDSAYANAMYAAKAAPK
jgi:hypothetical protein